MIQVGDIVIVAVKERLDAPAIVTRVLSDSVANVTVLPDTTPPFYKTGLAIYPTEAEARATVRRFAAWKKP